MTNPGERSEASEYTGNNAFGAKPCVVSGKTWLVGSRKEGLCFRFSGGGFREIIGTKSAQDCSESSAERFWKIGRRNVHQTVAKSICMTVAKIRFVSQNVKTLACSEQFWNADFGKMRRRSERSVSHKNRQNIEAF